ncbi:type II toxin-antitoxin system PemK/MazF family toxin [Plantibacter sp. Mn2098]|uniref:type II toxin-antitoxin system PemK/MazF family toxin n=1 Tax=Plantibacter sp. Mn2098 TaxID=3395266 RepID=UPI003BC78281
MASLSQLLRRVVSAFTPAQQPSKRPAPQRPASQHRATAAAGAGGVADASPGQLGPDATTEVDPKRVGTVTLDYNPVVDGDPDPGEIVWTWVPFEERDGRGKDRPVLVVATTKSSAVLAVQLTSKDHSHQGDFVPLGTGSWDAAGRPSWANLDRVFLVHPGGMRREAAALDARRFGMVATALRQRYGWR